jgi:hypothetical protein
MVSYVFSFSFILCPFASFVLVLSFIYDAVFVCVCTEFIRECVRSYSDL